MTDIALTSKPILERFRLDGRVALVTGGAQGIGRAFTHALGEAGAAVAIVDIDDDNNQAVLKELYAKNIDAIAIHADVSQAEEANSMVEKVLDHWGKLTIAINNAGIGSWSAAEAMTDELWDAVLGLNLRGVFLCCRAEGRVMLDAGYGKIINTASMSARVANWPQKSTHYNASKAGVVQLTRNLAVEWATRGVRVNSISPGYTRTKLLEDLVETPEGKQMVPQWVERTPMHRLGEVTDLQGAAVFLASEVSDFMTGHDMVIDGGYCAW
jgi:NAD(P)-dependent dehydrogenase (short-subunit alcohol dehydrogenase family)